MKKILAALGLLPFIFSFVSCNTNTEEKDITCEEIVKVYEDAGYYVSHGRHQEKDFPYYCHITVKKNETDVEADHIYFTTYWTKEQAEEAAEVDEYHFVKWLIGLPLGEYRWLSVGTYGKIEYSYYDSEMIKPFNQLIEE